MKERDQLSEKHYAEMSKWVEKVALLLFASLVVQKLFVHELADPFLYGGAVVSLFLYYVAYTLLIKS